MTPRRGRTALGLAMLLTACAGGVEAHTTATGLAIVTVADATVTYRLTLVLAELPEAPARLLASAADGDRASAERVGEALRARVGVGAGGVACRPGRASIQGSRLGDGRATLEATFRCPAAAARLTLRDDWSDLFGKHYRTLARIEGAAGIRELAFLPDAREATVELAAGGRGPDGSFLWLGVEHILTGFDHLLFLAALLVRGGGLWALLRIITAFTLAHSATLALAVLGLVAIPARVIEPAIAASIVWVAIENVFFRGAPSRRWLVSFVFGLVHGLGFASALGDLALPPWSLAMALLGFNLGVEAGQGLVIAVLLPLVLWMRPRRWEPQVARAISLALALVGAAWLVERLLFA